MKATQASVTVGKKLGRLMNVLEEKAKRPRQDTVKVLRKVSRELSRLADQLETSRKKKWL